MRPIARSSQHETAGAGLNPLIDAVVEVAPDALVVADTGGRITLVNAQAERLFGYVRDELFGQSIECSCRRAFVPATRSSARPIFKPHVIRQGSLPDDVGRGVLPEVFGHPTGPSEHACDFADGPRLRTYRLQSGARAQPRGSVAQPGRCTPKTRSALSRSFASSIGAATPSSWSPMTRDMAAVAEHQIEIREGYLKEVRP